MPTRLPNIQRKVSGEGARTHRRQHTKLPKNQQSPCKNPQAPHSLSPTATTNLLPQTAQQLPSRHHQQQLPALRRRYQLQTHHYQQQLTTCRCQKNHQIVTPASNYQLFEVVIIRQLFFVESNYQLFAVCIRCHQQQQPVEFTTGCQDCCC